MIPSGGDGGRSRDSELPLQRRGERGQLAVALNAAELRFGGEHAGGRPAQRISPDSQHFTRPAWSRMISIIDSIGLVDSMVRRRLPRAPSLVSVSISDSPSRSDAAAPGRLWARLLARASRAGERVRLTKVVALALARGCTRSTGTGTTPCTPARVDTTTLFCRGPYAWAPMWVVPFLSAPNLLLGFRLDRRISRRAWGRRAWRGWSIRSHRSTRWPRPRRTARTLRRPSREACPWRRPSGPRCRRR